MEKVDCGLLLHQHLTRVNKKQKWLANKLKVPEGTISSWIQKKDIKVSNLIKVCSALEIELWQYFAPEDLILPEFSHAQKQLFSAFSQLPNELQDKGLDIITNYCDAYIAGKEDKYK